MIKLYPLLIFLFLFFNNNSLAQGGIRGKVLDEEGSPLAFTTIFVQETGSGSTSNIEGSYELKLKPGSYSITFQFLGYKTNTMKVSVGPEMVVKDVVMLKQAYLLSTAEIDGGNEDPAYSIMRKAIAKSKYHRQQLDGYTCQVYLKGGGRLVDVPFFLRKTIEKEGIDTSAVFVSESVSEITYKRPATFTEKVISIRSSGEQNNSSPMRFINGSFYEPMIAGKVSPLSPKAFAYYKFKYISSFTDRGYTVNKIEIIPRSMSEDVVKGFIYIVEDLWCINSLNLIAYVQGIKIEIRQMYAPVQEGVWLPVSHQYDGNGKIYGVEFEFNYLATVSNYDVTLNPDLSNTLVVVDEKTQPDLAEEVKEKRSDNKDMTPEEQLASGEEITRKDLRKLLKKYEKEERKEKGEPKVVSEINFEVDSLAHKSDSLYWEQMRPVPLNTREIKGYKVQDSLALAEEKALAGDTLASAKGNKFSPLDLFLGNSYRITDNTYFRIHPALTTINFNTVDGFNFDYQLSLYTNYGKGRRLEISPIVRYAINREKFMPMLKTEYRYGLGLREGKVNLSGGRFYSQLKQDGAIVPFVNTFYSLLNEENYMKIYDKDFVALSWEHPLLDNLKLEGFAEYSINSELQNTTNQVWFPQSDRDYTPNRPYNISQSTNFGKVETFTLAAEIEFKPWQKYYYRNNEKYKYNNSTPTFTLNYRKGIPDVLNSKSDFDFLSLSAEHTLELNRWGSLGLKAEAGKFLNQQNIPFPFAKHFEGNRTILSRSNEMSGYNLLPYYTFSTDDEYVSAFAHYTFRKLLFTQIPKLRLIGVEEHFNVNYLQTPHLNHYTELSYSITNIFRLLRLDITAAFVDGKYDSYGIQIGFSSKLFQIENND